MRAAVVSQIRGLLLDRGFAIAKSITRTRRLVPEILSDLEKELTSLARKAIAELHGQRVPGMQFQTRTGRERWSASASGPPLR